MTPITGLYLLALLALLAAALSGSWLAGVGLCAGFLWACGRRTR